MNDNYEYIIIIIIIIIRKQQYQQKHLLLPLLFYFLLFLCFFCLSSFSSCSAFLTKVVIVRFWFGFVIVVIGFLGFFWAVASSIFGATFWPALLSPSYASRIAALLLNLSFRTRQVWIDWLVLLPCESAARLTARAAHDLVLCSNKS